MRRRLRIIIKIIVVLLGVLLLIWLGLRWYINTHKKEILAEISAQLSKNIHGDLHIGDMEPTFVMSFPYFSVSLREVSLRDSMWAHHHHDLLKAERIFVELNPFSLLRKPRIHQVTVADGDIFLFTDSTGYSNGYMLQRKDTTKITKRTQATFNKLAFRNVHITFVHAIKHKLFKLDVHDFTGKMKYNDTGWVIDSHIAMQVQQFCFNTEKGSFLKDKLLEANLSLSYSYKQRMLHVPKQKVNISGEPVHLQAQFFFATEVPTYRMNISGRKIPFRHAASLVTPSISHHLDSFDFERPIDAVQVYIRGNMRYRDTPYVYVTWKVDENAVTSTVGNFDKCSFTGSFSNEVYKGYGHGDANSAINLYGLKVSWLGIPLVGDTIHVVNLRSPELYCRLHAAFPVSALNAVTGAETFAFNSGNATANIVYHGGLKSSDTAVPPSIQGDVHIYNASATYLPRNLSLSECNATLTFLGNDLLIQKVHVRSGQSVLNMEGRVDNFLNLYFKAPDKMMLDWHITSPLLNLNEFSTFLAKRKTVRSPVSHYNRLIVARRLNTIMDKCNVNMQMHVDKLLYKTFRATNINAGVSLLQSYIKVDYLALVHAGGSINASGDIVQQHSGWRFLVNADVNRVNISQLFYAFDNFGQKAIEYNNLKGSFSAQAKVAGAVQNKRFQLAEGNIHFNIDDGALVHFEPLENIGKYAFKKRNLGNITFSHLENDIEINKGAVIINPMWIRSSALDMQVQGVYDPPQNTNLQLEVPLKNPEKVNKKGIILYLHVSDGNNGKLKIGWDRSKGVLKKFSKKKKGADSADVN